MTGELVIADLAYADLFVGDGVSSSVVSGSALYLRLLADERPSCVRWGEGVGSRNGEESSAVRLDDLLVRLGSRFGTGPSTCI